MIKMLRLDERLIHGQIAIKWSRHLSVDRIIVANDEAAGNALIQKSLMMAAPPTCKTAIKSVDEAVVLLNDPRCEPLKILIIVSQIADVQKIIDQVKGIPVIQVGNYGRLVPKLVDQQRETFAPNLYAYPYEVDAFMKLIASGIECIYQTTPEDAPVSLKNALHR
ncbi:MAG: PTS sugar transporter subunit IIB [Erysipelotrichaceae bacterium]|jgi:PTS system mannose-specific IIB component|nr:PTS sugar transporter subunit IIB [Erysipelotrichaceae bacterium]